MHIFRDHVWLRRATGIAILSGIVTLGAWRWREDITSQGTYLTSTYNLANTIMHASLVAAVVAACYVATSLILTPKPVTEASEPQAARSDWDTV